MRETDLSHAELPESSASEDSDNTGRVLCPICRKDLHQHPLILLHGIQIGSASFGITAI
jgi:hypothetical protein